jgi:hypothetical protein
VFAGTGRGRLLLLVGLSGVVCAVEAAILHAVDLAPVSPVAPQATALVPYSALHDVRWVLVFHRSWPGFVGESLAAIAFRSLMRTVAVALAWPAQAPRPSLHRLARRNLLFTALLGALLSPWAAMGIVATDVSMSWYVFGELLPVLLLAPFVARGGIVPRTLAPGRSPSGRLVRSRRIIQFG